MANFNTAIITEKGINLLAKAGETTIEFTRAATGDGAYTDEEVLSERTSLKAQKQEFPISSVSVLDESTVYLRFIISNSQNTVNLENGYYIKEVGIFANDPDEGEILYAITTAVTDQWDYLPKYNELMPSVITMEFYTKVNNSDKVCIKAGCGAYATADDVIDIQNAMKNKVDKVEGKCLSTNDYTTEEKNKLSGIQEGAEVNVQADWNVSDSNSDAYIKNKPQAMKNPTSLNISLNGISQGAYDGSSQKNVNVTAESVGADSSGTAETKVSEHNGSEEAHADIRNLITTLTTRLNTLADSDDTTLDQLSEIVAYIKNNKSLIDGITTSKVNVSDIIDNLTSSVTNKPLSAKQGKILKDLITTLTSTVDGKVNKAGDTMTGDLIVPVNRANANMSVPCAGRIDSTTLIPQGLSECKTFLGSVVDENSTFWNIISIRHGNGYNDGRYFGIYIRSLLLGEGSHGGSLLWNKQMGSNKGWLGERVLLDSQNYKDFCTPANMGLENVNNTPDYLKSVQSATYLSGWGDTRNIETKPSDYSEKFKPVGLKTPTASKITTGSSFATLVGIRGWSDASAGKAHELAFDGDGKLLHRAGLTSWEGWREIAHIDDLTSKNIGALSLDGGDMNENATIYMTGIDTSIVLSANNGTSSITNNIVRVENNVCRLSLLSKIGTSNKCGMEALTKSNGRTGKLCFYDGNFELESYNTFTINVTEDPDVAKIYYFDKYGLYPIMENVDIGRSNFKWRNIYAMNGTIQTSDRTKKTNINSLEIQKAQAFIYGLNPVSYKMIDGTSGRTHYGFIAQDIEKLMNTLHMDSKDFAGFIKSPKKIIKYEDENGIKLENPIEEVIENEYDYALRYDEFIAPLIKVVQEQQKTIEQQQRMIEQQQVVIENQQKEIGQIKKELSKIYSPI